MKTKKYNTFPSRVLATLMITIVILVISPLSKVDAKSLDKSRTNAANHVIQPKTVNPTTGLLMPLLASGTYTLAGSFNIPDNNVTGACGIINVPDSGIISGVNLSNIGVSHTYIGDLEFRLYSPDGTYLALMERPGRSTTGFGDSSNLSNSSPISFSDANVNDAETMGNTIDDAQVVCQNDGRCSYFPNRDQNTSSITNFGQFNNGTRTIQGNWLLCAYDFAGGDTGSITTATLNLTYASKPSVTINKASGQSDPANTSPINFTVVFSEPVTGFVTGDVTPSGTAGATTATITEIAPNDGTTYNVAVSGMTGDGTVIATVPADVAVSIANNLGNSASTVSTVNYDTTSPTVTITSGPANPTNSTSASFIFTTAGSPTTIECDLDGGGFVACDTATTQPYAGPLTAASHTFTVRVTDSASNTSTDTYTWTIDTTTLTVTVEQAITQTDPTNTSPINFTATFSKPINTATFIATDVVFSASTAPGTFATTITEIAPNNGTTFNIAVSGMTGSGTVVASIAANTVQDPASNNNSASTSTDNTVTYDTTNPTIVTTNLNVTYTGTGPSNFTVTFNKAVDDPAGNTGIDDVTNPANYMLVNKGADVTANTLSCLGGVVADDLQVTVTSVGYNNATFTSTVTLASTLPVGSYRLFVCGTTSIVDLTGNPLNGGTDYTFDFVVQAPATAPAAQTISAAVLPATGFPQGKTTVLPIQSADKAYASTDLWLEIPKLGVKMSIVGVPQTKNGWEVSWLDKNAGWLNGSAYPTWKGNSVITAHVWDALNKPGPFAGLKDLKYGDQIKIHAFGQVFTYELRETKIISPSNIAAMLKHEEKSWLTLITCEAYQELTQTYSYRRMIRAVLVDVTAEK